MSESPQFTPQEIYTTIQSLHYGKKDWLGKVASGAIKRPVHEIDRVAHERDVLGFICSTYERKFAGSAG